MSVWIGCPESREIIENEEKAPSWYAFHCHQAISIHILHLASKLSSLFLSSSLFKSWVRPLVDLGLALLLLVLVTGSTASDYRLFYVAPPPLAPFIRCPFFSLFPPKSFLTPYFLNTHFVFYAHQQFFNSKIWFFTSGIDPPDPPF